MNTEPLSPIEKCALDELNASGAIDMLFQNDAISSVLTNLVCKGYAKVTADMQWVPTVKDAPK